MAQLTIEAINAAMSTLLDQKLPELELKMTASLKHEFGQQIIGLQNRVVHLEQKALAQEERIQVLERELESKNQYDRRDLNSLIISGVPILPNKTPKDSIVTGLRIAETLRYKLEPKDIDSCHRMKTSNPNIALPFIIKFVNRHIKFDFMREVIKQKPTAELFGGDKKMKIFLNNQLSPKQSAFLKTVKGKVKDKGYIANIYLSLIHI